MDTKESLTRLHQIVESLTNARIERDRLLYKLFKTGLAHRLLGKYVGLSESRVKAICLEQKKLQPTYSGKWPELKG